MLLVIIAAAGAVELSLVWNDWEGWMVGTTGLSSLIQNVHPTICLHRVCGKCNCPIPLALE